MCYNIASVVFKATELYELPSFFVWPCLQLIITQGFDGSWYNMKE